MKVILIEDVDKLGKAGEVVDVKGGYGRNYLLPRGIAIDANEENMANWQEQMAQREEEERQRRENAENIKDQLEKVTIELEAKSGEDGKLFGSITNADIADALAEVHGINIERRRIELESNIRQTGITTVDVRVYPEVVAQLKVNVSPRED